MPCRVSFYVTNLANIPSVQSDALEQVLSRASNRDLRLALLQPRR